MKKVLVLFTLLSSLLFGQVSNQEMVHDLINSKSFEVVLLKSQLVLQNEGYTMEEMNSLPLIIDFDYANESVSLIYKVTPNDYKLFTLYINTGKVVVENLHKKGITPQAIMEVLQDDSSIVLSKNI